jgi:hypothetical protein
MKVLRSLRIRFLPWPAVLLMAAGFACWIAFALIGSTVDSQGVLHEPFGLIPIGWLLLLLGGLVIVLRIVWVGLRALWQAKR